MRLTPRAMMAAAGLAAVTAPVLAGPIEVIYTKKQGHAKSEVPGTVNVDGNPVPYAWRAMEGLSVMPDGSAWFMSARTQAALVNANHDVVILKGAGTTGSVFTATETGVGTITFSEGRPAVGGNWFDFWASSFVKFDTAGNAVFAVRTRLNQLATGGTLADAQRVLKWDKGTNTVSIAFKQGDLYTGLTENPASGPQGDEAVGNSIGSAHLLDNGVVGSHDGAITNIYSLLRPAITYNLDRFHQISTRTPNPDIETTTVGAGVFGNPGDRFFWAALDANEFHTTPDGLHHYIEGRVLDAPTTEDGVLVYDGEVKIKEGSAIPGSSPAIVVGDIFQTSLLNNGDWYSRGRDNSGTTAPAPDWFVKNGVVLARTADAIFPGSSERWGDTFYSFSATTAGDWVLVGRTDNPNPAIDDVIVLNGTTVLMREGDPVDLDGNGQFDDDAFIGRANNTAAAFDANDRWFLTSDGYLYGVLQLRDGAGNDLNTIPAFGTPQAFIRMQISSGPAPCYANCDESTTAPVLNVGDFTCFLQRFAAGESYANCDNSTTAPVLNVGDFTCFLQQFAAGCP